MFRYATAIRTFVDLEMTQRNHNKYVSVDSERDGVRSEGSGFSV